MENRKVSGEILLIFDYRLFYSRKEMNQKQYLFLQNGIY